MVMVRKALLGVIAAALVVAAAPVALAHAAYKSSNPADESTVSSPPSQVTAEFTEPLTDSSSMSVFDPCGEQVDHGDSQPSGYEMSVSMTGDKAGTYTVQFRAQSALDSHVTGGSFTFTSSGGDPCPGSEPPPAPGGGGGAGSGGGPGGGSGGAGSGGGAVTPQDPTETGESGAGPAGSSGGDERSGGGGPAGGGNTPRGGNGRGPRAKGGPGASGPVAFQPAGRNVPEEPAPWDLPLDGVVMAFVLCVMIGAAGGRVYAGIVAPPRR